MKKEMKCPNCKKEIIKRGNYWECDDCWIKLAINKKKCEHCMCYSGGHLGGGGIVATCCWCGKRNKQLRREIISCIKRNKPCLDLSHFTWK